METVWIVVLVCLGIATLLGIMWKVNRASIPCPASLAWLVERDNPFTKTNQARYIVAQMGLQPSMKVLDAGCGPGRLTLPLAEKIGPEGIVVALDLQPEMLERVQQKAQAAKLNNIRTFQAGLGEGKLEANQFDRAVLVTVLGEIPNREAAMKELFAVLKPGGILSVNEIVFDPHFQTKKMVLRLAEEAGFQQKQCIGGYFAYLMHLEKPSR